MSVWKLRDLKIFPKQGKNLQKLKKWHYFLNSDRPRFPQSKSFCFNPPRFIINFFSQQENLTFYFSITKDLNNLKFSFLISLELSISAKFDVTRHVATRKLSSRSFLKVTVYVDRGCVEVWQWMLLTRYNYLTLTVQIAIS